jgi:uncharacterized protein (TIGR03663 family)
MNRWVGLGLLLITTGALGLRSPHLGLRPMHNDEAVNAIKIRDLWQSGRYRYDPDEHHGPTLYYATLPFVWLSGAPDFNHLSEGTLRAVSVFFGVALIAAIALLADGLGPGAALLAGLLTALSPAMVFYSRYFIHEMLLVGFTALLIGAGWRYGRTRKALWAILAGLSLGLMYATKETFIIPVTALVLSLGFVWVWNRGRPSKSMEPGWTWSWPHFLGAFGAAALVSLLFFTSFGTNASGPLDSLRTYMPWLKRAEGASPHIHPWYFYLQRLAFFKEPHGPFWTEGFIVILATVGGWAAFRRGWLDESKASFAKFLTIYTLLGAGAYSVIAYKTPWCLLGFLQPMILLAGIGAVVLWQKSRAPSLKALVALVLLVGLGHLGWQAVRASYLYAADPRNPYVYAQTAPDTVNLVEKVRALARTGGDGDNLLIKVMAPDSDYWPLPWYLRQFKRVGWWDRIPADPYAPIMIVGARFHAALDEKSDKRWLMVGYYALRPKTFLELYVKFDLWQKYVEALPHTAEE